MRTVLRFLFVIPFGFVAACLAASFAMLWPFLGEATFASPDPLVWIEAGFVFLAQGAQIGSAVLVPWGIFMVLSEIFALSSLLLHLAAGAAGSFAVLRLAYGAMPPRGSVETALIVAGLSFALVYWLLAGHRAGRWRRAQRPGVSRIDTAKPENTEAKT